MPLWVLCCMNHKGAVNQLIVTDFKMFYVLREIYFGNNVSISYDILYFTHVLWELF